MRARLTLEEAGTGLGSNWECPEELGQLALDSGEITAVLSDSTCKGHGCSRQ